MQDEWASLVKDYDRMRIADPRIDAVRHWTVPVITLDSLGLTDVTALKIDAEGAEARVLRGAMATLARCRPCLSVEIEERHCPGSTVAVPALLAALGYEAWFEFWGRWRPMVELDVRTMQRGSPSPADFSVSEPYIFTFYFVAPERRAELGRLAALP